MSKKKSNPVAAAIRASERRTPPPAKLPPDPEEMNEDRAESARVAVENFASDAGELPPDTPRRKRTATAIIKRPNLYGDLLQQNLQDLLCNFAHLCDRNGLQLRDLLRAAEYHYTEETDRQGEQFQIADGLDPAIRDRYISFARDHYAAPSDDDLEIDDSPALSIADDGVWVAAWVWVRNEAAAEHSAIADTWNSQSRDERAARLEAIGESKRNAGVIAMNSWEQLPAFTQRDLSK